MPAVPKSQPSEDKQAPRREGQGTKEKQKKGKKLIKELISLWVKTSDQSEWQEKKELDLRIIHLAFI